MTKPKYLFRSTTLAAAVLFAASAHASLAPQIDMSLKPAAIEQSKDLVAKKGTNDGRKGRGRGRDDGPNHAGILKLEDMQVARRGDDDAPGHTRRGRGSDDAPGHVRHGRGADDGVNDHGRRGRGSDDGAASNRRGRGSDDGAGHGRRGRGSDDKSGDDRGGRRS